ncbi:3D domain-containing protein [Streptomyces sp. NPDC057927]
MFREEVEYGNIYSTKTNLGGFKMKKVYTGTLGLLIAGSLIGNVTQYKEMEETKQDLESARLSYDNLSKANVELIAHNGKLNEKVNTYEDDIKQYKTINKELKKKIKDNSIQIKKLKDNVNKLKLNKSSKIKNISRGGINKAGLKNATGRVLTGTITHYGADCNGCSGTTATGVNVQGSIYYKGYRIIATDPSVIPLHSLVRLDLPTGSIIAIALDTGSAIKGTKIDLLVGSEVQGNGLGVYNNVKMTVIREGK